MAKNLLGPKFQSIKSAILLISILTHSSLSNAGGRWDRVKELLKKGHKAPDVAPANPVHDLPAAPTAPTPKDPSEIQAPRFNEDLARSDIPQPEQIAKKLEDFLRNRFKWNDERAANIKAYRESGDPNLLDKTLIELTNDLSAKGFDYHAFDMLLLTVDRLELAKIKPRLKSLDHLDKAFLKVQSQVHLDTEKKIQSLLDTSDPKGFGPLLSDIWDNPPAGYVQRDVRATSTELGDTQRLLIARLESGQELMPIS